MRRAIFIVLLFLAACKSDTTNPSNNPPIPGGYAQINFVIGVHGLPTLRSGERYILWWKTLPDTSWKFAGIFDKSKLNPISADSSTIVGSFYGPPLDSIIAGMLTILPPLGIDSLGYPILLANNNFILSANHKELDINFDSKTILGNFSATSGSIVFTSPLPDSLAYEHEFYLMHYSDSGVSPSLGSLPSPPAGWQYGLWAEDLTFTPNQHFFYGLFSGMQGHSSDSSNAHYPYPGSWKPQTMDVGSGEIIITLEPLFYGDSLKYKTPSPFKILEFPRIRFIDKNKNYPMTNISERNFPRGVIIFRR